MGRPDRARRDGASHAMRRRDDPVLWWLLGAYMLLAIAAFVALLVYPESFFP